LDYHILLLAYGILIRLNFRDVSGVNIACFIAPLGDLVNIVTDVPQQPAAFIHGSQLNIYNPAVNRLFEKIRPHIRDVGLTHALLNHIVFLRRDAEVD
jgi:hypothetical protein